MKKELQIKEEDRRKQLIGEIIEYINEGFDLYIWGANSYGDSLTKYLKENGIKKDIIYVVDDEYFDKITQNAEKQIISLSTYLENYSEKSVMIFGFYNYEIIKKKRAKYGDKIKHLYDFHMTVIDDRRLEWNAKFIKDNLAEFNHTYTMFEDEKSRQTMQLYLNAATAGEFEELYENCHEDVAYFNDLTKEVNVKTLLDCGAYDGDSIHDFIQGFPNYEQIYAFEPDSSNVYKIHQREKNENIRNLTVIEKGVYSETKELYFEAEGKSSSHLTEQGEIRIQVMKLDELKEQISDHAMIKMDIEGSELEALNGARELIRQKKPCLSICVYHKEEDMITIPQYIESIVEKGTYKYYLRFHGLDLAELVFYAIPSDIA